MCQGLGLISVKQNDLAGPGLLTPYPETLSNTIDLVRGCRSFSVCRGQRQRNPLFA
jgi:hypothetical protein